MRARVKSSGPAAGARVLAHPDFCAESDSASRPSRHAAIDRETDAADLDDVAIDFVDMAVRRQPHADRVLRDSRR